MHGDSGSDTDKTICKKCGVLLRIFLFIRLYSFTVSGGNHCLLIPVFQWRSDFRLRGGSLDIFITEEFGNDGGEDDDNRTDEDGE